MPQISIKPPLSIVVLAGLLVMSYFTHVGWWTWLGLSFLIASLFADEKKYEPLVYFFSIITLGLFILGIITMRWVY